jgi:hypothetical protein
MSKFLVICTEHHYPSIYVCSTREYAELTYKSLTEGFKDWSGYDIPPVEEAQVEIIEVVDTSLRTIDWASLGSMHPDLDGVFL